MSISSDSDTCDIGRDMPLLTEVQGYQFEPVGEAEFLEEEFLEDEKVNLPETREQIIEEFTDTSTWCNSSCKKCQAMPTRSQNRCCWSIPRVKSVFREAAVTACICDHPYVNQLLQEGPLALEYIRYLHIHEDLFPTNPTHADNQRKQRFCSYRILINWIYPELEYEQRRPLPACLRSYIQARFPPVDEEELFVDENFLEYAEM